VPGGASTGRPSRAPSSEDSRSGWDSHWNTDRYFEGHPFLTEDAAQYLVEAGAALVGIDSLNIDDTRGGDRPVHTTLLGRGIPIVEHMTGLERLQGRRFRFSAAPVKVEGMGSFPVRAFAVLEDDDAEPSPRGPRADGTRADGPRE